MAYYWMVLAFVWLYHKTEAVSRFCEIIQNIETLDFFWIDRIRENLKY